MEQNATRCIHREILSINLEALVCKLVLAECPESKNMAIARDASIMKVHLMSTDLYKLISEAADTCTIVTQATKYFIHPRHSPK